VVERSLESLAADRGITICFAELDGADGLWVPEERTVLLSRALSDRRAAEVLEHELSHVDIEDGHAALDATIVRRRIRTRWAVAATAAISLTLLAGIRLQLNATEDRHPRSGEPVAGAPSPSPAAVGQPTISGTSTPSVAMEPGGRTRTETVTVTPPLPVSPALTSPAQRVPSGSPVPSRSTSSAPATSGPPPTGPSPTPTATATPTPTSTSSATPTAAGTPQSSSDDLLR
jgi:Putative metallopeptidase family (DUF6782)